MSLSSHHAHTFLRPLTLLVAIGLSVTTAACASSPTPPPVAAEPTSNAFDQAAGKGATNVQPPSEDGVVFVEQEHKEPTTHGDEGAPATPLQANPQTARPNPKH
jgi:hypothetical protein